MFVQTIAFRTDQSEALQDLMQRWATDALRDGTASRTSLCRDRDHASAWQVIVEFPSYDAAMRNSERPETDTMYKELVNLCDGEPAFGNLDVNQTWER